jgi:hypothetical protein
MYVGWATNVFARVFDALWAPDGHCSLGTAVERGAHASPVVQRSVPELERLGSAIRRRVGTRLKRAALPTVHR